MIRSPSEEFGKGDDSLQRPMFAGHDLNHLGQVGEDRERTPKHSGQVDLPLLRPGEQSKALRLEVPK